MRILILGCGPAGLIAAHTAERLGHEVSVASRKNQSVISGAQVLHEPITGVTESQERFSVNYVKVGTQEGYALKVYGNREAPCSWPLYPAGQMDAWPMRATYGRLWAAWQDSIQDIDDIQQDWFLRSCDEHDLVFSTVPLPQILAYPEWDIFSQQAIWVVPPVRPEIIPPMDTITYFGDLAHPYYRSSYIRGAMSWEYAQDPRTHPAAVRIVKPLDVVGGDETRRELVPENCHLVGRYGKWKKGELAHHAQAQVEEVLK